MCMIYICVCVSVSVSVCVLRGKGSEDKLNAKFLVPILLKPA